MACNTLASTEALAGHLDDPAWIVFDCRHDLAQPGAGEQAYAESHIPGARFLHLDRDLAAPSTGHNGRHPLPDPEIFARKLAAAGVNADTQVVCYDAAGGMYSARLWWMLRWLGHADAAVLDGGWVRWLAEHRPISPDLPKPLPGNFRPVPRAIGVDARFIVDHLDDPDMQIVDARAEDRFRGENETMDPVGGHIPGALNRFFRNNLDASGRFKPAAELRSEFLQLLGARSATSVVHQCGSGVSACHNLLAMEVAQLPGSRLYPGSWSEWCADPGRPMQRGKGQPVIIT